MPTYETTLTQRQELAEGTMAFHLKKPPGFQFIAGQYLIRHDDRYGECETAVAGETGYLTKDRLRNYLPDLSRPCTTSLAPSDGCYHAQPLE